MKADKLYLGNIITMDEIKPRAKALTVKNGLIQYVGSEDIARSLCDENTEIIDLGENCIYPGFMEAHCHPTGAGKMLDTESVIDVSSGTCLEEYVQILSEFIKKHPGKSRYGGVGFMERDVKPQASMLDAVCKDVPVMISSTDGHSMWLNTKAMEVFGIDRASVEKYEEGCVRVDENGNPTGYISEKPVFEIRVKSTMDIEDGVRCLKNAQQFFFSKGYTAIYDAGVELIDKSCKDFYKAAIETGEYKLRTYAGSLIDETCEDIKGAVANIAAMREQYNSEYFKIIGVKTFSDGVVEAHTAYLLDDYLDQEGYKGVARMVDHDKLVDIYATAAEYDMNVHVHTVGDAAIRCNLDAIEDAVKKTGKMAQRNALAHLQVIKEEDIKRFADLNVVAVTAPLWTPKHPDYFPQEVAYVGKERAEAAYPIRSFVDAGALTVYHTDFPVSREVSIPGTVYQAVMRKNPAVEGSLSRESDEAVTRYQALLSMTKNVAAMWHEETRMGSLEVGKIANMTVYDKDFLEDDLLEVFHSELLYTIVDGEIVYSR